MSVTGYETPDPSPGRKRPWMLETDAAQDYLTPTKRTNVHFDGMERDYAQPPVEFYGQSHPPSHSWGFLTPELSITGYGLMDYSSNSGSNYAWMNDAKSSFTPNESADGAIEEVCFGMVRPRGASHGTRLLR
jgi:hypothetical protein